MSRARHLLPVALLAVVLAACGDDGADTAETGGGDSGDAPSGELEDRVRLLTHESFALSEDVLAAFTEETGIEVEVLRGADAGSVVNQAVLSAGDPQGDVLFGIDTTFLTRGLDEGLFEDYESPELGTVEPELLLDGEHRVTPIDVGDVCVNYDRAFFEAEGAPPVPETFEDLADPAYRDLLVVEDPASSSPGLVFLAGTIAEIGEPAWEDYWASLRANGVEVAASWSDAYYGSFSGGAASEGDRPLVVSYASSPPVEVLFAETPIDEAPTGVVEGTCVRQVEYAGVLAGAEHPNAARALIDFLLSPEVQADIPLNMFVYPVVAGIELPEVFVEHAEVVEAPVVVDPFQFGEGREDAIERWDELVLG
jgi:thiamine transport system substrate-binding protein